MKIQHRLAYYLFGLMMGAFVVVFIFNKRGQDFCYMPNCRVLKNIRSKGLTISKEANQTLKEGWVTQEDIKNTLEYGDVDFSKSNKPSGKGGKLYVVEGKNAKGEPITVEVANSEERALLIAVKKQ